MADETPDQRRRGRPFKPGGPVKSRLSIRAGDPWESWISELAATVGLDKALIVDRGLELYARSVGFRPPPSRYD